MNAEDFKRKLTTVFSADVAGYSRLMGEDEAATVKTITAYRGIMATLIMQHRGRIVDTPGDNVLAEFSSVVDATQCAVAVQKEFQSRNAELPENRRMQFRIGINLGDVIEEGERIYGDGVNIAARLEALADPGGICISQTAFDQIETKLPLGYEYMGEHSAKNISRPVPAYRVLMEPRVTKAGKRECKKVSRPWFQRPLLLAGMAVILAVIFLCVWNFYFKKSRIEPASLERMAFPLPEKPSIAVLPFTNMSGDRNQDYIGDGISESIISALSKVSRMFVIARNSTFVYKEKAVKVQQVAEELGVRYVVEGSVQRSGDRLRITAQLIDALSGHHLWSEKYDRKMRELFDLQDEITKEIVVALQVELTDGEQARILARSTENLKAWSLMVRGYNLTMTLSEENNARSHEFLEQALKLDPECGPAWSALAFTYMTNLFFGWGGSPVDSMMRSYEAVKKALALDDNDANAYAVLGSVYLFQMQHEKAIEEGERAISIDPNSYVGYAGLGISMYYSERFQEAITLLKKAMRLSPYYPAWFLQFLGMSYGEMGRYDEAIATFKQLDERCKKGEGSIWWAPAALAFVYLKLGREKEARALVAEVLKLYPSLTPDFIKRQPFKDPVHKKRILEYYKKAGFTDKSLPKTAEKPSIAVLPFINISNDPEQEYFSDGITEELITALAKLEGLKVISRTSVFWFKGKDVDLAAVGEKLKVDNILEGSVRKAGNKLRITAQLIRVADDTHLWAETFDREMKDVFAIQEEISAAIVNTLKVRLLGRKIPVLVKRYTENPEVYNLYLKARFFENKGPLYYGKAKAYYERVIEADPAYAPAYAALAWVCGIKSMADTVSPEVFWPKVKALALKALELDDMLAGSHVAIGLIRGLYEYDFPGFRRAIKYALELDPNHSGAREEYAFCLAMEGRLDEAVSVAKKSLELDPFSIDTRMNLLLYLGVAREHTQAMALMRETLELAPDDPQVLAALANGYAQMGMYNEGIRILKGVLERVGNLAQAEAELGYIYAGAGMDAEARKILDSFLARWERGYFPPYFIAFLYAALGETDNAFEWIDRAYEKRDPNQIWLKLRSTFDYLHSDPRWNVQMKKRGWPES